MDAALGNAPENQPQSSIFHRFNLRFLPRISISFVGFKRSRFKDVRFINRNRNEEPVHFT